MAIRSKVDDKTVARESSLSISVIPSFSSLHYLYKDIKKNSLLHSSKFNDFRQPIYSWRNTEASRYENYCEHAIARKETWISQAGVNSLKRDRCFCRSERGFQYSRARKTFANWTDGFVVQPRVLAMISSYPSNWKQFVQTSKCY